MRTEEEQKQTVCLILPGSSSREAVFQLPESNAKTSKLA
jgi:hypothetical protein